MPKRPSLLPAIGLTVAAFRRHNASRFGAALAFYIVFSVAPTLLIAIAVAGHLFGRQQAEREILERIIGGARDWSPVQRDDMTCLVLRFQG